MMVDQPSWLLTWQGKATAVVFTVFGEFSWPAEAEVNTAGENTESHSARRSTAGHN